MTFSLERARTRKPITWLTVLGILLLPAVVGGILVAALQNPTKQLDTMTAAVVNLDKPVTIDGQLTPLGRQLSAGLVEGSDELDSNLTWVISNSEDAADGLADGTYQAVVTIPKNFSAAATSSGQAIAKGGGAASKTAKEATITVTTPDDGPVADDLITNQLAAAAARTMSTTVAEATMQNVLVGYTTIGDQVGEAATGALQLADGARDAASGAAALPDGAAKLATGAAEVGNGATSLANGLDTLATKTRDAAAGAAQIGAGLSDGAATLRSNGIVPDELFAGANGTQQLTTGVLAGAEGTSAQLAQLVTDCAAAATPAFCDRLAAAANSANGVVAPATQAAGTAAATARGLAGFDDTASQTIAAQMEKAGAGSTQLALGLNQLTNDGLSPSATGARQLAAGAGQVSDGATELATGAEDLATGLDTLATGTGDLAGGLRTASDSLPSFTDTESTSLASVIAEPVTAKTADDTIFGPTAIPLLAAVALWFGAFASFVALRAYTSRALTSRRSSGGLALRAFAPSAVIGVGQALLVALIVQFVAEYDAATWWAFAATAALASVTFAAVNQALVAVLGGVGRWISVLIGVLTIATGLISTVPEWLTGISGILPTAPAFTGLIEASGAASAGLIAWGVLSLIATTLAVAMNRTTSAKTVLAHA